MKKFLGVSFATILAVMPVIASAADPTTPIAPVATNDTTVGVASTKYVKEAYNAMAGKVNAELGTINTALQGKADSADLSGKANVGMDNLSNTGKDNIAKVGTYSSSTTYSDGTIGAAIKAVNTTAGNAADKNLSNLSATGKANVSAQGTYDSTANYTAGTVGAAIKGKQDTISDLATIRSGAEKGATSVQSVAQGSANGTISVDGTDVSVKGLGSAAYTASTAYASSAQGTKADNAATKSMDNLNDTGKANIAKVGTYSSSTTYSDGTIGAAIKGKQDTISDLATIRSGAEKGATSVQSVTASTSQMANGTINVDGTAVAVKGLGSAAYTNSNAYATSAQGTKADNAATAIGTGTLNTTATTLIAAVNEVNGKKLTVYSGWNSGGEPTVDTNKISLN